MQGDFTALEDSRRLAGIEIEDDRRRPIYIRHAREQHMLFDVTEICHPEERRAGKARKRSSKR